MSIFKCTISVLDADSVSGFNLGESDSAVVTSLESGKRMLLTHGNVHGQLLVEDNTVDAVACCFPCRVRAMNPQAPVIGSWVGTSRAITERIDRFTYQLVYGATQAVREWSAAQ